MNSSFVFAGAAALLLLAPDLAGADHGGKHLSVPSASVSGATVSVSWRDTPGNSQDWVTVVKAGTADTDWGQWTYTRGAKAGSFTAKDLAPGEYEARLYYDYPKGGFTVIERVKFTMGGGGTATKGAHMSLSAARYGVGQPVVVAWFDTPGNAQDWITVVKAGTADTEWGEWTYLNGAKSGKYETKGLRAGTYEARLYYDYPKGGFKVIERLTFEVQ